MRESFSDQEGDDNDVHASKLYTAVSAFLLVCIGVVAVASRTNRANDEERRALDKKGSFHGIILLSMIGICMIGEAAGAGCTVGCGEFGTPLPNQTQFETKLFIPEVHDFRNNCTANITMYMNINENYDWGIKDENGTTLNTTIYGYVLLSTVFAHSVLSISFLTIIFVRYSMSPDGPTYFPGPTLVVSKDCSLTVTFHNNLGIGPHLFAIDPSVDCGPNAPNCTATNGSQRRVTTQ